MGKVLESARAWLWTALLEPEIEHAPFEESCRGLSAEDVLDQEFEDFKKECGAEESLIDCYPEESAALYLELGWPPEAVGEHYSSRMLEAAQNLNKQREAAKAPSGVGPGGQSGWLAGEGGGHGG